MKALKIFSALAMVFFLTISVYAAPPVADPSPDNLVDLAAFYDFRDRGVFSHYHPGGSEGRSGAFFQISAGIGLTDDEGNYLNPLLTSWDQVVEVKAKNLAQDYELVLLGDDSCDDWLGKNVKYWSLFVRPDPWMFESIWEFTLKYKVGGVNHLQILTKQATLKTFPTKPSSILVMEDNGNFIVSWSGIGPPFPVDYRVRVFGGDGCVVKEFRMLANPCWGGDSQYCQASGQYDFMYSRVEFQIPDSFEGYNIRLENRIMGFGGSNRACQHMTLF